jgi:hypothetical protein
MASKSTGQSVGDDHEVRLGAYVQLDVVRATSVVGVRDVRQRRWVLLDWAKTRFTAEWLQGSEGHDPRRDGGRKVLRAERAKRDIFPFLNVASWQQQVCAIVRLSLGTLAVTNSPLQSFISTTPKMWLSALLIGIGSPRVFGGPTKKAWASTSLSELLVEQKQSRHAPFRARSPARGTGRESTLSTGRPCRPAAGRTDDARWCPT